MIQGLGYCKKDNATKQIIRDAIAKIHPNNVLQVFSGRRGFHLHLVGDLYMAMLENSERNDLLFQLFVHNRIINTDGSGVYRAELERLFVKWIIIEWNILDSLPVFSLTIDHPIIDICSKLNIDGTFLFLTFRKGVNEENFENFKFVCMETNPFLFHNIGRSILDLIVILKCQSQRVIYSAAHFLCIQKQVRSCYQYMMN